MWRLYLVEVVGTVLCPKGRNWGDEKWSGRSPIKKKGNYISKTTKATASLFTKSDSTQKYHHDYGYYVLKMLSGFNFGHGFHKKQAINISLTQETSVEIFILLDYLTLCFSLHIGEDRRRGTMQWKKINILNASY